MCEITLLTTRVHRNWKNHVARCIDNLTTDNGQLIIICSYGILIWWLAGGIDRGMNHGLTNGIHGCMSRGRQSTMPLQSTHFHGMALEVIQVSFIVRKKRFASFFGFHFHRVCLTAIITIRRIIICSIYNKSGWLFWNNCRVNLLIPLRVPFAFHSIEGQSRSNEKEPKHKASAMFPLTLNPKGMYYNRTEIWSTNRRHTRDES
jgi:hypothetical protein